MDILQALRKVGSTLVCPSVAEVQAAREDLAQIIRFLESRDLSDQDRQLLTDHQLQITERFSAHRAVGPQFNYLVAKVCERVNIYRPHVSLEAAESANEEISHDTNGPA